MNILTHATSSPHLLPPTPSSPFHFSHIHMCTCTLSQLFDHSLAHTCRSTCTGAHSLSHMHTESHTHTHTHTHTHGKRFVDIAETQQDVFVVIANDYTGLYCIFLSYSSQFRSVPHSFMFTVQGAAQGECYPVPCWGMPWAPKQK